MTQNDRKLTLNLYYQAIEYSDGLKTFPMAMKAVYIVQSSVLKHHYINSRVFKSLLGNTIGQKWPKILEQDPQIYIIRLLRTLVVSSIIITIVLGCLQ